MVQPYDWSLEKLQTYKPELTREDDFGSFWDNTLLELGKTPLEYKIEPYNYPVRNVEVYNILYKGFKNVDIDGWLVIPSGAGLHPGLVLFPGYNSGFDGKLHETVNLALHGYICLQVIVRGQGGRSGDNNPTTSGHALGWLTQGILDPNEYYYRAVYMDAVRAVEVLASLGNVDIQKNRGYGGKPGRSVKHCCYRIIRNSNGSGCGFSVSIPL